MRLLSRPRYSNMRLLSVPALAVRRTLMIALGLGCAIQLTPSGDAGASHVGAGAGGAVRGRGCSPILRPTCGPTRLLPPKAQTEDLRASRSTRFTCAPG